MTMPTTFFSVCVSMSDWVHYPDESECFFPNMDLKKVLEVLDVDMNICELYEYFFDDIDVGTGDVFLYKSPTHLNAYFMVNLYREMTDQLDNVVFYINSPEPQLTAQIKPLLRNFFDHASYQFAYRENCASTMKVKVNESESGDIYQIIEENGYEQKIIIK